uniref:Uncharacterized protein n=1 Tax=Cannabis sativa TaxID=3483 RepID=A0A803Q495_CANSA
MFCSRSSQQVNKLKTSIFFNKNTPSGLKREIQEALGIGSRERNVKYLGLPLFRSRQKDVDFNFIMDNLSAKLDHRFVAELLSTDGGWDIHKLNCLFDRETVSAILRGGAPFGMGQDK